MKQIKATEHVINWIGGAESVNDKPPIKLSRTINSFEADFANGYLFGEILAHYGICESVSTFSKKSNKEGKVQNFFQIEEALRLLKVPFDAKLSHQIMNEEPGASIRLLYQLKLGLERYYSPKDVTVTNLKKQTLDKKVKYVEDLATKLPKIHKDYGIEGPTFKAIHTRQIENKLLKYELAKINLEKRAHEGDLAEINMLTSLQQQKRQEALRKLNENQQFMKEWEKEGKKNWKQNRETRAKEIARQMYFEDREIQIFKDKLNKQLDQHTMEMIQGYEDFQENMQKLGIEQNISIQEAVKRQEEKKGIPPGQIQNFSYAATMNKIKETKNNNEFAGKERERRNRKMLVDQRKIQETLDAKKTEEMMIQRLLEEQTKEKNEAYTVWRRHQCQNIIEVNRKEKAEVMNKARAKENKKLEAEMKRAAEEAEAERRAKREQDEAEYKQIRRQQKYKKRGLNIEIASEVIDLITDLADEAFDYQLELFNQSKENPAIESKISKAQWRQWMGVFEQGQKVSEQNLVINQDEQEISANKQLDSMSMLLSGSSSVHVSPQKLLQDLKNEPILDDFYQYLTMTGPINLRLVAEDKWFQFKTLVAKDPLILEKYQDLSFLDSVYLPQNKELGKFIEKLFGHQQDENMTLTANSNRLSNTEINNKFESPVKQRQSLVHKVDFPTYHTLKLCLLGRAFAGKTTQAQQLAQKLGHEKVTTFNMGEIIREALSYVDPNQAKEEVADPKAKGKGKPPVEAGVDAFQGQDTTKYKDIAHKILQQIQLTTGDKDHLPGKDIDIVGIITDDHLLVQLFLQKLKLTFKEEGHTVQSQEAKMRENILKEKELIEQLEEAKANEGADADPKGKGKGGKASKSPAEIEQEIQDLKALEVTGWILVDFPRNLNQALILENSFTGFELSTDVPKSADTLNFETWTKFTDPTSTTPVGYDGDIVAQQSLFDGIFFLESSKEECFKRAQNRKIDPQTGTVYNTVTSPPPEGDTKLHERLTDYFSPFASQDDMVQKLDLQHISFNDNEHQLRKLYESFGSYDLESRKGLLALKSFDSQKPKDDLSHELQEKIQQILAFKQLSQDRKYEEVRNKMKREEEERLAEEARANEEEANKGSQPDIKENEDQDKREMEEEPHQIGMREGGKKAMDHMASKTSLQSKVSNHLSQSKVSSGGLASKKQKKRTEFNKDYKIKLIEEMETAYIREGIMTISDIKRQRDTVIDQLNQSQSRFIQFLERPCEKQARVDEFVHSFNKFSVEFPDLRKDDQTKEELMNRLEQLSNALWNIIVERKDESIEHINKMSTGGWSDHEMRSLLRNMASLIEIEIKKFETVYRLQMLSEPPVELDAEIITKKLLNRGVQAYDGESSTSPVLEQVIHSLLTKLDDMLVQNPVVQQIIDDQQGLVLMREREVFIYRLALIHSWAMAILEEIYIHSRQVYNQLDDWIVIAVAQENSISQQVLQILRDAIQAEQIEIEPFQTQLQSLQLFQMIETLHFSNQETPLYLRDIKLPTQQIENMRFSDSNLRELYNDFRFYSSDKGSYCTLDSQTFINLLALALRHGKAPLVWKYYSFDKISQLASKFATQPLQSQGQNEGPKMYQSKLGLSMSKGFNQNNQPSRTWVNWKRALTFFCLLTSHVPTEKELGDLRVKLTEEGKQNQTISKEEFTRVHFWFERQEGKPDSSLQETWDSQKKKMAHDDYDSEEEDTYEGRTTRLDNDRVTQIKEILFDIFRIATGEDLVSIPEFINQLTEAITSEEVEQVDGRPPTFSYLLFETQS